VKELNEKKSIHVDYRHLAFFFIGAVVICAIFFSLGFVVGRSQAFESALKSADHNRETVASGLIPVAQDSKIPAEETTGTVPEKTDVSSSNTQSDYRKDLDFYDALKDRKIDQNFHPEPSKKKVEPERSLTEARKKEPSGSLISLQVAALRSPTEAAKLVKSLKSKGYPVFTVNPAKGDPLRLIRVQVGPYSREEEAVKVKERLGQQGFSAIVKR
jgi:cell division septation protein DedD